MKADKTIRLLKTVPTLSVNFTDGQNPYFTTTSGLESANNGWVVEATANVAGESATFVASWEDTIDISGISAADLSLINQGGAIATCIPPSVTWPETAIVHTVTYVSVNPVRGTYVERINGGNALSSPGEAQDWFLATSQTYARDATGVGYLSKIAENNWGTGGIASSTKLFIKCYALITRQAIWNAAGNAPYPLHPPGAACLTSPQTIGIMCVTAEMDAVQTAAAIYRGNDLQQSYDNP